MTAPEQPQPSDEQTGPDVDRADVDKAGGGRTEGETRVDDDLGSGDQPG